MKLCKKLFGLGAKILMILCLVSTTSTHALQPIKVGICADYPPFEFKQKGKLVGLDVELANRIGETLDAPIQFVEMDYAMLIPALQSQKVDMAISAITMTKERAKHIDFTPSYFVNTFAFVTTKHDSGNSIENYHGKKIGAQLGSTMEQFIKAIPNTTHQLLEQNPHLIAELKLGRIDAVALEAAQAHAFCDKNPGLFTHVIGGTGEGYAIAFAKHSALMPKVTIIINQLKQTGYLDKLQQKWIHNKK